MFTCSAVFALGQFYYSLNLSSDLAVNLPRFKDKTQNCFADFFYSNMTILVAVLF